MLTTTIVAIITFFASILLIPLILLYIPSDYFIHPKRQKYRTERYSPLLQWILVFFKNLIGTVLIIAGIAMLFLPGQGMLTILAGLFFVNFPSKYRVEKWIITRPKVLRTVNWIRKKAKRDPLQV
ncbi:MAG: PGPGW domain-containing protein [Sulfurimonas sp.]